MHTQDYNWGPDTSCCYGSLIPDFVLRDCRFDEFFLNAVSSKSGIRIYSDLIAFILKVLLKKIQKKRYFFRRFFFGSSLDIDIRSII